ncbi:hypothetical protein KIMH_07660 [Bombiscardovia apis]|uniref:Uncharacterized protein n=1 Tax=Bombiscardovia apis TaxID=2932182 RepID=A0ABN6SJ27_9BIFI|nr:hypothetical protein KIMH_07660 [Bombiscardovia apis]
MKAKRDPCLLSCLSLTISPSLNATAYPAHRITQRLGGLLQVLHPSFGVIAHLRCLINGR